MGTVIDFADIQVGDTVRLTHTPDPKKPVVVEGVIGKECFSSFGKAYDFHNGEHVANDYGTGFTTTVELIDRPEPPKPTAKVGETLTTDHAEPPVGAKALEIERDGSWLLFERVDGGWRDQHSPRPNWRYREVVNQGSFVIHLPGE